MEWFPTCNDFCDDCKSMACQFEQRITELGVALKEYGQHEILCPMNFVNYPYNPKDERVSLKPGSKCTCGLEQALRGEKYGNDCSTE